MNAIIWLLRALLAALFLVGEGCAWRICGIPGLAAYALLFGAILADALTPLGLLNFLVLQWFGVRLTRWYVDMAGLGLDVYRVGDRVGASTSDGRSHQWRIVAKDDDVHARLSRLGIRRWIWPLTGWWSDFRWIARRS